MSQMGFFDADRRLSALAAKGDPLLGISALVPWETFRADIEAVVLTAASARKGAAGRKPIDALVLLRMLVLQSLYNLSDEQIEHQVRDRLSFTRFLGLGFEDRIPDGTTLWLGWQTVAGAASARATAGGSRSAAGAARWGGSTRHRRARRSTRCGAQARVVNFDGPEDNDWRAVSQLSTRPGGRDGPTWCCSATACRWR